MSLNEYRRKRRFSRTPEPPGHRHPPPPGKRFVVQEHAARRRHYDFRLEIGGVLKSWAVPKGPCLDPAERRLAVHVEDHPLEYGDFEGAIPEGEYGAGAVIVWDRGSWTSDEDPEEGYRRGKLKFELLGEKLHGRWTLVRMRSRSEPSDNWLLIKERDEAARPLAAHDVLAECPQSVLSGLTLKELAGRPSDGQAGPRTAAAQGAPGLSRRLRSSLKKRKGAVAAPIPSVVQPQLAKAASRPPVGDDWLHEIKFDGYRLMCHLDRGRAVLRTRNRLDWTARFPELAQAVAGLPVGQALLDGEIVALLPSGASSFQALQNALSAGQPGKLVYYAFDVLYLDGYDLRGVPLEGRKELLREVLQESGEARLQYSDHIEGNGPEFFQECARMGLEGIVSKRRGRPSRPGRCDDWRKVKCVQREEFVIGGYTGSTAARRGLGAIHVGYYNSRGELIYAGKVGSGFSDQILADLRRRLEELAQAACPFADAAARTAQGRFRDSRAARPSRAVSQSPERDARLADLSRGATRWIRPELVAQVEFSNWTGDGLLWHPRFQGLREDRCAAEVVHDDLPAETRGTAAETEGEVVPGEAAERRTTPGRTIPPSAEALRPLEGVRFTHPDRVLYAGQGITKLGLAAYYVEVADWILPHVSGRLLSLVRCPGGRDKPCFFQKHAAAGTPESIRRVPVKEKRKQETYLAVDDLRGLVSLVQMGVLEIHPWGARTDDLERPDRITFDLDPDPAVPWEQVVAAARELRERLGTLGLTGFVKTTGGKGLHVVVPVRRRHSWNEVKAFSQAMAERMAGDAPQRFTARASKAARRGRIYVDYLRNDRGATAIAAYSTRAQPGAPVATPLSWEELTPAIRSDHFEISNLPGRLAALCRDPWEELSTVRQSLTVRARRGLGIP